MTPLDGLAFLTSAISAGPLFAFLSSAALNPRGLSRRVIIASRLASDVVAFLAATSARLVSRIRSRILVIYRRSNSRAERWQGPCRWFRRFLPRRRGGWRRRPPRRARRQR